MKNDKYVIVAILCVICIGAAPSVTFDSFCFDIPIAHAFIFRRFADDIVKQKTCDGNKNMCTDKCKEYTRQFVAFMFSNVGIIVLVIGYTITGAFVFKEIESMEVKERPLSNISAHRNETVRSLYRITCNINVFAEEDWKRNVLEELKKYQERVVEAAKGGFLPEEQYNRNMWTFSSAFLYSLTVITTIGYGNVTPRSEWGKVTTIVYAIIGMPLFLLYLSNIGEILAKSFKWTYARCCLCKGFDKPRKQPVQLEMRDIYSVPHSNKKTTDHQNNLQCNHIPSNSSRNIISIPKEMRLNYEHDIWYTNNESSTNYEEEYDSGDLQTVTVPVTLCLAIMVGYVCLGAILFSKWEEWEFLDSSYFCFISLSTIGFGDLVPGDKLIYSDGIEWSFIFCSMYLMLGMALIAMCFNLMQEEVIHKMRSCMRSIKYCCGCNKNDNSRSATPS